MNAPLKVVRNPKSRCGGPLINWNSMDTGTQTQFGFRGDAFTRTCTLLIYCNYVALQIFWLLKNSIETELQNFWLLKNSIETECGFSRSAKLLFPYIFVKNILRSSDTCFVKYLAVLGLCCACGRPLTNWNSMDTGTQTQFGFRGDMFTRTC